MTSENFAAIDPGSADNRCVSDPPVRPKKPKRGTSEARERELADALRHAATLHQRGEIDAAATGYRRVLSSAPHHFAANHLLGVIELHGGRPANAVDLISQAVAVNPNDPDAQFNLGAAYMAMGRADRAVASLERAAALRPRWALALTKLGNAFLAQSQPANAIGSYRRALALEPQLLEALNNNGFAHLELGEAAAALDSFDRLLRLAPRVAGFLHNRGEALRRLNRQEEAARAYAAVMEIAPDFEWVVGKRLGAELGACNWVNYGRSVEAVESRVLEGRRACAPFEFLAVSGSTRSQLACATTYAAKLAAALPAPDAAHACPPPGGRLATLGDKLRIAYVSADFANRPVALLMVGVLEQHDRARFEIIGIALRPPDASEVGLRMARGVDRLIDVSRLNDREVSELMSELDVHIAVDLMGHTQDARQALFLQRIAPVQVAYLGFPATTGMSSMDYLLADDFLIPPDDAAFYSERIVYLPDCFQANDDRRSIGAAPTRAQAGLPEDAFVFCSFNNCCKFNPVMFDIWCRLLEARPGSVLWLLADGPEVETNLRREAKDRGVDPARLIFAGRAPYQQHLARQTVADLFLDSLPFNAGTTASDALRAGLPLLTCAGNAFASRMAGSLLRALALPELITYRLEDYERRALALSLPGSELGALRDRLRESIRTSALFDTSRFCRNLEAAYDAMWAARGRDSQSADKGPMNFS